MRRLSFGLALFVATSALADEPGCVLPLPDGGDVDWSAPSLTGVVAKAGAGVVTVLAPDGKSHLIHLSESTQFFTVYGGSFEADQLAAGQHALVWLDGCSKPGAVNRAAVLQVCSLTAEPCAD
jgi:hypothetical protein